MARWAWHAYKGGNADASSALIRELEARVYSYTDATFPSAKASSPPSDEFATSLLKQLRQVGGNHPEVDSVLADLRGYTERLIHPDVDPLRDLCTAVLEATIDAYETFGIRSPDVRLRLHAEPRLEPQWKTFPSLFNMDARVEPNCSGSCCEVTREHLQSLRLQLAPAWFDGGTLAALPFALFHECVSHVLQGPYVPSRPVPDKGSQFAEGWMDLAAWTVFAQTLGRTQLFPYPHDTSFYWDGGVTFAQARRNTKVEHDLGAAQRRATGWQAAWALHQLYQQELGFTDPDVPFLRLSFHLNASAKTPTARDSVVTTLRAVLRPEPLRRVQSLWAPLVHALVRFNDDTDLEALLAVIEDVRRQITPFS
ncbi:hypothetical protein [Streptomyces sp. NPDC002402]